MSMRETQYRVFRPTTDLDGESREVTIGSMTATDLGIATFGRDGFGLESGKDREQEQQELRESIFKAIEAILNNEKDMRQTLEVQHIARALRANQSLKDYAEETVTQHGDQKSVKVLENISWRAFKMAVGVYSGGFDMWKEFNGTWTYEKLRAFLHENS